MDNILNDLNLQIDNIKNDLMTKKGARDQIVRNKEREQQLLLENSNNTKLNSDASLFLLTEIAERRHEVIDAIEKVSSIALQTIYEEDYELKFDTYEEKRKEGANIFKMDINIKSKIEGKELITGIDEQRGGGLVEITAFMLRIAALDWLHYSGPLILDEAYKSMSEDDKILAVARFLKEVSNTTNRQIIFVTHKANIFKDIADKIVLIEKNDGVSSRKYILAEDLENNYDTE